MKSSLFPLLSILLAVGSVAFAQGLGKFPTIGLVERHHPDMEKLIAPDAQIEVLASGFIWSEGPVWDRAQGRLLFSDVPANKIYAWSEEQRLTVFMDPSGYTGVNEDGWVSGSNGLAFDDQGRLLACEHGDRRVSVLTRDGGGKRTVTDNIKGQRLNSPNDLVIDDTGNIWFTDPSYGLPRGANDPRRELDYHGVFLHRQSTGKTELATSELAWPNGIALSPDEKTLYVAQSSRSAPIVMAYPINPDLSLGEGSVIFDMTSLERDPGRGGNPDGLKVDQQGNLWISGRGGIQVVSPTGEHLGSIVVGQNTANCGWGDDGSVLYITADMYLVRIQTMVTGDGF